MGRGGPGMSLLELKGHESRVERGFQPGRHADRHRRGESELEQVKVWDARTGDAPAN